MHTFTVKRLQCALASVVAVVVSLANDCVCPGATSAIIDCLVASVISCRVDPYVYRVIKHYTRLNKLSFEFIYGWRHYIEIGLAPVE